MSKPHQTRRVHHYPIARPFSSPRRFVGALLVLGSTGGAVAEDWTRVTPELGLTRSDHVFVDRDSLTMERPVVGFRQQGTSGDTNGRGGPVIVREIDCSNRSSRTFPEEAFSPIPRGDMLSFHVANFVCGEARRHDWRRASTRTDRSIAPPSAPQEPRQRPVPNTPDPGPAGRDRSSTGSGFYVSPSHVVTNYHVVRDCSKVSLRHGDQIHSATVTASTQRNDLAVLRSSGTSTQAPAVRLSAMLGEEVTVAGYPLTGLLSEDLVVTGGHVNSLAGIANDPTLLQVSAPVQPGNSGGPLIDRSGNIVGVVVSKLNAERLSQVTGDIAQNVNFAIKPEVLRLFLDTNRIPYAVGAMRARLESVKLAEQARSYTVQVLCEVRQEAQN